MTILDEILAHKRREVSEAMGVQLAPNSGSQANLVPM